MKVMKFGGTSVGTPERMKSVARMVSQSGSGVCCSFSHVWNDEFPR